MPMVSHPRRVSMSQHPIHTETYGETPRFLQAPQMLSFRALTQNAFTTVFAGFAFTFCILPNISLVVAFVAAFFLVLIVTKPGIVNLPFATSPKARSVSAAITLEQSDFFCPVAVASASAIPLFGRARTPFFFMTFMAFIAFTITVEGRELL